MKQAEAVVEEVIEESKQVMDVTNDLINVAKAIRTVQGTADIHEQLKVSIQRILQAVNSPDGFCKVGEQSDGTEQR